MEDLMNDAIKERDKASAKKMLHDGKLSLETIAEYSGLTLEKVNALVPPLF